MTMENIEHRTSNTEHRTMSGGEAPSAFNVRRSMFDVPKWIVIVAIRAYQLTISPAQAFLFGPACGCRFTPTCSQYAIDAIRAHGAVTGGVQAIQRICRCHPFGGCGHDPVSPKAQGVN